MAFRKIKNSGGEVELKLGGLNPKQKLFCQARTKYIAYGGARGGGKTHVARLKAIMGCIGYPGIRILFVRREYPELEQTVIIPMRKIIPAELAAYNGTMHMFTFINGSIIKFGHFGANDELEYQGQEYDWIFMDEATQFTEDQFLVLCACLRGANKIPKRIYLTCNPGGIGHFWVKRLFVTRDYKDDENPKEYSFIKATVRDNPQLMENNPDYVRQLEHQPRTAAQHGLTVIGTLFPARSSRKSAGQGTSFQISGRSPPNGENTVLSTSDWICLPAFGLPWITTEGAMFTGKSISPIWRSLTRRG